MKLKQIVLKDSIAKLFEAQTYFNAVCKLQNKDWQISSEELKKLLSHQEKSKSLELIVVLPNLKLPFKVDQTIPIQKFDVNTLEIDFSKTYVMVCQRGFNSYIATKMLKKKYPTLKVLSLFGGISNYNK